MNRDKEIAEDYKKGRSQDDLAKALKVSRWQIRKALKRQGVSKTRKEAMGHWAQKQMHDKLLQEQINAG